MSLLSTAMPMPSTGHIVVASCFCAHAGMPTTTNPVIVAKARIMAEGAP